MDQNGNWEMSQMHVVLLHIQETRTLSQMSFFLVGGKYKHVNPSQKRKKLDNPDAVAVCKFSNNSLFSVKSPQEMTASFVWCRTRLYALEIYQDYCTWYMLCKFSKGKKSMACNTWTYKYNSMICYRDICCP